MSNAVKRFLSLKGHIVIIVLCAPVAYAGWNEPVQLTPNRSYGASIVSNGNYIHIMSRSYPYEYYIEYFKSSDYGQTWATPDQFADSVSNSGWSPKLTSRDSMVCAAWEDDGFNIAISSDNGQTWRFKRNILMLEYDFIYGFQAGLINYRPYFMCNRILPTESGQVINFNAENIGDTTWGTPITIMPIDFGGELSTVYNNGIIHCLSWTSVEIYRMNMEPYYLFSTDDGFTWSSPVDLRSDSIGIAEYAKMTINERGDLLVYYLDSWLSRGFDSSAIVFRTSNDNGISWSDKTYLTASNAVTDLALGWGGNTIAITYTVITADRSPDDLYCQISNDNGASWNPEYRLTDDSARTSSPAVSVSNDTVYVAFCSESQPGVINRGLYFRRYDPEPQGTRDNTPTPSKLSLTAYPNPFNSSCYIKFAFPKQVHVIVDVYNILGQKVATLLNEQQQAGEHTVVFVASNLGSGLYFCRLTAGDYSETKSLVLIK